MRAQLTGSERFKSVRYKSVLAQFMWYLLTFPSFKGLESTCRSFRRRARRFSSSFAPLCCRLSLQTCHMLSILPETDGRPDDWLKLQMDACQPQLSGGLARHCRLSRQISSDVLQTTLLVYEGWEKQHGIWFLNHSYAYMSVSSINVFFSSGTRIRSNHFMNTKCGKTPLNIQQKEDWRETPLIHYVLSVRTVWYMIWYIFSFT